MLPIPQLQIRQTRAQLGMETTPGQYSIRQPKAELQQTTTPAKLSIEQYKPQLQIDQSRAFAAYTGGGMREVTDRLVAGFQQNFLQSLSARAELGTRMAAINEKGSNPIADIYAADTEGNPMPETRGAASMDNVDIRIQTTPPKIEYTPAEVEVNVRVNKPEIEYQRGKIELYMLQRNSVEFTPPSLDTLM